MIVAQQTWTAQSGWRQVVDTLEQRQPHLILVFGARAGLEASQVISRFESLHPDAILVGCSTAGEIEGTQVHDGSVVATLIHFEKTRIAASEALVTSAEDSRAAGEQLARQLSQQPDLVNLRHVLVLSDGLNVNGTTLAQSLRQNLPAHVAVTGGLAGDGDQFASTRVVMNGTVKDKRVVAIGLYGDHLTIGYGSLGGWDSFGPQRMVTKSEGNVLYELDGQSALDLYKQYLGSHAADLPGSALLFPLSIHAPDDETNLVRTVLSIDEVNKSMTFAGDIPQGHYARLMKANCDRLVDGAAGAATNGRQRLGDARAELAILISCVGRKLVLKQRVEEEVEAVREVLGDQAVLTGFYSYGEICPSWAFTQCDLHNQTMTITTLSES